MDNDFAAFVTEFQRRLDAAESLADMLAPGARLASSGDVLEGIEAIDAWVIGRRPDQVVRHVWNNLRVVMAGDRTSATLRYIATAWHGDDRGTARTMTLGDVVDRLVPGIDRQWLLAESSFARIFKQTIVQES
ncbi:MAG: nuclear transport factor 2 family protein [Sphingobium sp.]